MAPKERADLLNFALRSASRALVANDRAWAGMIKEKTRQVGELEQAMQHILTACAESVDGTVSVDDIYRTLSGVRQV